MRGRWEERVGVRVGGEDRIGGEGWERRGMGEERSGGP